jgi:hypothetical protein
MVFEWQIRRFQHLDLFDLIVDNTEILFHTLVFAPQRFGLFMAS